MVFLRRLINNYKGVLVQRYLGSCEATKGKVLQSIIPRHSSSPSDAIFMLLTLLNLLDLTAVCAGLKPDNFCQNTGTVICQENKEHLIMAEKMEVDPMVPPNIKPLDYNLFFNPDLEAGTFEGTAEINIIISSNASYIPLHAKDLDITMTLLTDEKENSISITTWYSEKHQFWVLSPKGNYVAPGNYIVSLEFKGKLLGKIVGFYRSDYIDVAGKLRSIATTKFEPVDARQAFPCFDEPALKAKFSIRIVRPKDGYLALSNMNSLKEEDGPLPNTMLVHFPETVPMSTYLVCFIISDFLDSGDVVIDNMGKSFPVKVYSTPTQVTNTLWAKKSAAAVTKFYIDYFNIPYPLPKLDLIAIPDFVSGAMENWGLITFRETALLFNEKENAASGKQRVAIVVSHEISHQWFGNLVTMKWWDDLWLNEGFASFMQYKGVDEGIPDCKDWQILDHAIYEQIYPVLKRDALVSSHPIIQPVSHPNQITEIFDAISYNKGHAVIRMLESFMGADYFKLGIQKYLKSHEYGSATTADLWNVLNREVIDANINVGDVMDTWTRQMGYPIIIVEKIADGWILKQSRFLTEHGATFDPNESPYKYKWDIPVSYVDDASQAGFLWFKRGQKHAKIPRGNVSSYVKLNHHQVGFYRVSYPSETWKAFDNILKSNSEIFDRKDRANLLDDAFSVAEAGIHDYAIPLDLVGYLKNEKDFLPWAVGVSALSDVYNRLYSTQLNAGFRRFMNSLAKEKYGRKKGQFTFNVSSNDTHTQRLLRVKILEMACLAEHSPCLQDAAEKFLEWIKKPTSVPPDVRSLVFQYGMSSIGKEAEWNVVWERYLKETNPQEKMNLLMCLASVREPWIISNFLQLAKNESYVRSQDYFQVLSYISMNPVGNPIVWLYYRNEWPNLVKRFSLYHRTMGTFISVVTSSFSSAVELEEMENFFKKYPDAGAGANARKLALERTRINKKWLERSEPSIAKWLTKNNYM